MARRLADLFGGKYFKAQHFPQPRKLTVRTMSDDLMPDGTKKAVAWFKEDERGLVLNKTNGESLCALAGVDDLDLTIGVAAVLYADTTDYGGKRVPCVRIRAKDGSNDSFKAAGDQQHAVADKVDEDDSDEIPF